MLNGSKMISNELLSNDMEFLYKIENQKGFKSKTSKNYSSLCDLRRATLYYSL